MQAKLFRYLFENARAGLIQTGSIWDNRNDQHTDYMYVAGANIGKPILKPLSTTLRLEHDVSMPLNLFVLGAYTIPSIKKMVEAIEIRSVRTVVLPYVTPMERLMLAYACHTDVDKHIKVGIFLENPYLFLKKMGVENIYFVYGNDKNVHFSPENYNEGMEERSYKVCFELQSSEIRQYVNELEGYEIPLYKAGHIIENGWLFYFGCYGRGLQATRKFADQYFGKQESELEEKVKSAMPEFYAQFKTIADAVITMYVGPMYRVEEAGKARMMGKIFSKDMGCSPYICQKATSCDIKCMYEEDHCVFRRHNNEAGLPPIMGMLLLGNVNLKAEIAEITHRYYSIRRGIRCISVPNCGNAFNWNQQLPLLWTGEFIHQWMCPMTSFSSPEMLKDIIISNTNNEIVGISEENGYCLSGIIATFAEEDHIG
ncbi:MAG: hypothetical protein RR364_06435 [Lachnospiraceae bacterium]